jgi:uncharacterized protein
MRFSLKKKENKKDNFYDMLLSQAEICSKGMKQLHEFCITHDEEMAEKVILTEEEGDMARRILTDELDNTFITPLDREDLFKISSELDEILDYAKTSVDEIRAYGVTPDESMIELTSILLDMTEHIILAVSHMEKHRSISQDEAIYVKSMENKVGDMATKYLAVLFDGDDHRKIFKYREIYRHLNRTADVADSAMDTLLRIIVKMS